MWANANAENRDVVERMIGTARCRLPATLAWLEVGVRRLWHGPMSAPIDLRGSDRARRAGLDTPQHIG